MRDKIIVKDRKQLEEQLKKLAETEYRGKISFGAMCYRAAAKPHVDYVCPICGQKSELPYSDWYIYNLLEIRKIVQEMKNAGYDALLDEHSLCRFCNKRKSQNPFYEPILKFKIRYFPDDAYHVYAAKSMYPEEFKTALVFLKGGKSYLDKQEWTITMLEKIQTISKILGLGKDIKASEAALNALEKRREEEWNNYKEIN